MSDINLRDTDSSDWDGLTDKVLDLYGRSYSMEYIARLVGRNVKTVRAILKKEFEARNQNRQDIVQAHAQQVQWLKLKVTERLHNDKAKWDRRDAELLLKILEREARLFGVDQPTQHQHSVTVELAELPDEELAAQLRQYNVSLPEGFLSLPPASTQDDVLDAEFTPSPESVNEPHSKAGS